MNERQITALAVLISSCESLCASGALGERTEMLLRERVAETLTAFGLDATDREEREAMAHA